MYTLVSYRLSNESSRPVRPCSRAFAENSGSGVPGQYVKLVLGVIKAYSTRVGGGPFPTEQDNEQGEHIRRAGNEFGTTTGRPRRCGWFDAVAVRYTARLSGVDLLSVMIKKSTPWAR